MDHKREHQTPPLARVMGVGRQQHLMHMLSSDTTVDMIYLNFSKAFDKVDHGVLLHTLKDLGISLVNLE